MTLVNLAQVLEPARRDGRGLAAFNVIQIEHAEALAAIPDDEVRVDSGRASPGGTFRLVRVTAALPPAVIS